MPNPSHWVITAPGTYVYPLDYRANPNLVNVQVAVPAGVTAVYEVDSTLNNLEDTTITPIWTPLEQFPVGSSATQQSVISGPFHAIRLVVGTLSGGVATIYWNIIQASDIN